MLTLLVQAGADKNVIDSTFKEYLRLVFFDEGSSEEMDKKLKDILEKEVARGPMYVTPIYSKRSYIRRMAMEERKKYERGV